MKKLTIDKDEGIADVVERLLAEEDEEATIVVPKGSALSHSVANFHLLKREADAVGKTVIIESVDDTVLAFAKESELDASHPLWRGVRGAGGGVSDIIPASGESAELGGGAEAGRTGRGTARRRAAAGAGAQEGGKKVEPTKLIVHAEESEEATADATFNDEGELSGFEEKESRFFHSRSAPEVGGAEEEAGGEETGGRKHRVAWWVAGIVVLIFAVLGIVTWVFGHAAIAVTFQKIPWNYTGNFIADKSAAAADSANGVIPAQVFSADKNATQLFPASGKADVSTKAQGTITIYNDYSSAPQDLVATTRFLTPDGKLFRLVSSVTIPGATVKNGVTTPSSIQATVAADQPGPDYNVGPVQKLSIPGFKGSPKYDGFYGALLSGASGGATGVRPLPTAADIADAKTKMQSILQGALTDAIMASYPNNFKILDGATDITVAKLSVNTTTDENGNFSVFGEATLQAIGFDEGTLKDALLTLAEANAPSSTWESIGLAYGNVKPDFAKGTVSFTVAASGTLEHAFNIDDFKASIAGAGIGAARTAIANIPGLANGTLSVWPMWLWSIPSNPGKITVNVD